MAHPFRFAVQSFSADSAAEWRERAQRAEQLGYSALHLADHIIGAGPALERSNHPLQGLAALPAMCFAAAATSTLKIGCRVFCVDYRLPVMLAKEALTLDLLSEGRLELGLGAGWLADEYQACGIAMDSPGRRIKRLENVLAAMRAFAAGEPLDIANADVRWSEFAGAPAGPSGSLPPIMIGGGAPKILGLAGREADIVSLNFNNRAGVIGPDGVQLSTAQETARKIDWIRAGAGDRFDQLEIEVGAYFTFVGEGTGAMRDGMAGMFGLTPEQMGEHPHALFGTVDEVCETLQKRREAFGISYITVTDAAMESFAPVAQHLSGK